jgi:catechol 2,3-dioxygenase-like lactoylglutathione lyase family enzyme
MAVTGPDFISLQVRDLERSAAFYEQYLGLKRSDAGPPHAVVFDTKPIAFAVRDVVAGVDLDAIAQPGQGMALWLHGLERGRRPERASYSGRPAARDTAKPLMQFEAALASAAGRGRGGG